MSLKPGMSAVRSIMAEHPLATAVLCALAGAAIGAFALRTPPSASDDSFDIASSHALHSAGAPTSWTCAMHPQIRSTQPGKCSLCGMDLIPVTASAGGVRTLSVSPEARALMSVASAPVERKYVSHEIAMVGKVDYDETAFGYISAWVPGRLDELYVDYPGIQVNQGDHMVSIYSPQLYAAQEELIQALKYRQGQTAGNRLSSSLDLAESAREKLRLLGLTDEQLRQIEQQNAPTDHLTIYAPVSGVVVEKLKREGDYVETGERIYTVADLDQVWVHLDAYESDLPWIRYGQDVVVTTEAYPGEEFHGRIAFIQPVLNDQTRTVKVRVNVPNIDGKLKPDMFVHAVVRPQIAAGGRVMDPSLEGKWISPMHPEIVKDHPGTCDICGMQLVKAEELGFVTPEGDQTQPPLVIPYSAALVTGERAIVYVELPFMAEGVEAAFQGIAAAVASGDLEQTRQAFAVLGNVLDRPYEQPATAYARSLWNDYADQLAAHALAGQRAQAMGEAASAFASLEKTMHQMQTQFAAVGQPTFEGREIVLGPRADDYYLVRHGLDEGELVVTQGNFKIDAEVQIQAKPSMMTPEGGGGGGHQHGGGAPAGDMASAEHAGHAASTPPEFARQVRHLERSYEQVAQTIDEQDLGRVTAAFAGFGQALREVDGSQLSQHAGMQWRELAMLLGNDAAEGKSVERLADADRVFLLLKGHMRRLREQLGVSLEEPTEVQQLAVSAEFQRELAAIWERYLAIQRALAGDELGAAQEALSAFETAVATVGAAALSGHAQHVWESERAKLEQFVEQLQAADDIDAVRTQFKPLSEQIGLLAKTFGFGEAGPIYEVHCPMAFQGKGAIWYQDSDQVRNPYYGASMLTCADRVERLVRDEPATREAEPSNKGHEQQ